MNHRPTRKRVFVSSDIQGTILIQLARYWVYYHLSLWTLLIAVEFFQRLVGSLFLSEPFDVSALFSGFLYRNRFNLIASIVLYPIVHWEMLKLTHKIAGPLVRFRAVLRQLTNGDRVERVRLREGDLLTEFQDAFNEYLESLARKSQGAGERDSMGSIETELIDECRALKNALQEQSIETSLNSNNSILSRAIPVQ